MSSNFMRGSFSVLQKVVHICLDFINISQHFRDFDESDATNANQNSENICRTFAKKIDQKAGQLFSCNW